MMPYEGNEPYLFVSYSHKDSERVHPVLEALAAKGIRIRCDVGLAPTGDVLRRLEDFLIQSEVVAVFVTENANGSDGCRREIAMAVEAQKPLLPILLEPLGDGWVTADGAALFFCREDYPDFEHFVNALAALSLLQPTKGAVPAPTAADEAYERGRQLLDGADGVPNVEEALCLLRFAADRGHADAQCRLGEYYTSVRNEESNYWHLRAAEQGQAKSCYELYLRYRFGFSGVEVNKTLADYWEGQAVRRHYPQAQYARGYRCDMEEDHVEAVRWYRAAAEQDCALAQNGLGECYFYGNGVAPDEAMALRWYRKAAAQGLADAQFNLGFCYEHGFGTDMDTSVTEDRRQAAVWYRKAAEQGHLSAQYCLGNCYFLGFGVEEDDEEAAYWFQKAADRGHEEAQFSMGELYENGFGVEENRTLAVYWYRLAAKQGNEKAQSALRRLGVAESE